MKLPCDSVRLQQQWWWDHHEAALLRNGKHWLPLVLNTLRYPSPHAGNSIMRRQDKYFGFFFEPYILVQIAACGLTQ
jgi:hypothetical protein